MADSRKRSHSLVDSIEESKLRKLPEKSDSEDTDSTSDTNVSVPKFTSQWTKSVLDRLGIVVERRNSSATCLFKKWMKSVMVNKNMSLVNIETRAHNIIEHMDSFQALSNLDFECVQNINSRSARPFFTMTSDGFTPWTRYMPQLDDEKHWFHMFTSYAEKFVTDLRFICSIHEQGQIIKEAMYGSLFQDFLGLCGVHSFTVPLIQARHLKIGNTEVCSVPDMLLMDRYTDGACRNILVVIQANHINEEIENTSSQDTRPRNISQLQPKSEITIGDKMIGKHGGDLLLHCEMSAHEGGILGILIQNTHVAFTYLSCDEDQYENIKNGIQLEENCPSITVSKWYNFLKASDRGELIEPFVTLGLLQTIT